MAIVWSEEQPRERSGSGKKDEGAEWSRVFYVRTDSLTESIVDISNAPGIAFGDGHPDDSSTVMETFDVKAADGSGLLYAVTFKYKKYNPADGGEGGGGGTVTGKPPIWGGSSSVTTGPVYKDKNGNVMTNSAGDPLEGLEKEFADERLTLTICYASHEDWMELSRTYTNAINDAAWNGGDAKTWKCQGASKKLNIENTDGVLLVYWEVTWEFAYRADKWTLKPWDIGFAERVTDDGTPSAFGTKRRQIKGQDGKGVRQPVALANGMAKAAGQPPDIVNGGNGFLVYEELDFSAPFGEVFTPGIP